MGQDETKIRYETRDTVDPGAAQDGRRRAQAKNAQKLAELEEEMRNSKQAALQQAMQAAHLDDEREERKIQERKDQQKREQEEAERKARLRKAVQSYLQLKDNLLSYEFGSRIGKDVYKELDVSDMRNLRVALIGPTGSGKSCFIGTMERTLFGDMKQTNFAQGTGSEGTILLEEYLGWHDVIRLVDTRGFFEVNDATTKECLNIMSGRIKTGEEIRRDYDDDDHSEDIVKARSAAMFGDQVHGVIFVVKANDPQLTNKTYLERMGIIRNHFRFNGHSPVTVITYEDKMKSEEDREIAFTEASAATGSPRDRTFFISNYTHETKEYSLTTEKRALEILDTVLYSAERFVKIHKLRELHHDGAGGSSGCPIYPHPIPSTRFIPAEELRRSILIPIGEWGSSTGGIATINRTIAKQLAKKENPFEVYLYAPQGNVPLDDEKEAEKSRVTVVYAEPITGIDEEKDKYVWVCFPSDVVPEPDFVFGHARFYGPAAHCIRRLSPKTKWVQWVHMDSEELGAYKKKDGAQLEEAKHNKTEVKLCEEADAIVAVGPHLAEMYEWDLAYCGKKPHIIYPGIFNELEDVPHRDKDSKPFSVFVFGRGAAEDFELKGYDIAARSIAVLGEEYRLIVVGAEKDKIEEMTDKLLEVSKVDGKSLRKGSQLVVQTYCTQKEMRKKYSQADLMLMPSRAEGFGLTALEAISAGVPVLVSKYSGLAEALREVVSGDASIVKYDSYKVWASHIEQVRKLDRNVRLEQARTLRKNFGNKYSWDKEGERLSDMLMKMLPGLRDVPLVRLVQMAEPRKEKVPRERGTEAAGEQHYSATGERPGLQTPPPANQSGRHMGQGLSVSPAAAQAASPQNPAYKGNVLWEGTLEYGRVISDTYCRPGWQPPQLLYELLYNDNVATSHTEFQVTQDANGSISIFVDSNFRRIGKATRRFVETIFKA